MQKEWIPLAQTRGEVMENAKFENWAFVKPETHTEVQCTCPDCGAKFSLWIENIMFDLPSTPNRLHLWQTQTIGENSSGGWRFDLEAVQQTTLCSHCLDELDEESEEESFPMEDN